MIPKEKFELLKDHFRLAEQSVITHISSHLAGQVVHITDGQTCYALQFYETIHTKRQIGSDLEMLRLMANEGIDAPLPKIHHQGEAIDKQLFHCPVVLFVKPEKKDKIQTEKNIAEIAAKMGSLDGKLQHRSPTVVHGKKLDTFFTMFELLARDDKIVDEMLQAEYFAFKASAIDLLNHERSPSFAFFPGEGNFYEDERGNVGHDFRLFLYEMPECFSLAQLVLHTCFTKEGELDFARLDSATMAYAEKCLLPASSWDYFDKVLKLAAFFEVLTHWLAMIHHPYLAHADRFLEARKRQNTLKSMTLKEIG